MRFLADGSALTYPLLIERFNMTRPFIILFALVCLFALTAAGSAISISQDFDSGSVDVGGSYAYLKGYKIAGRKTWTDPNYANDYRWVYFKASEVEGLQASFYFDGPGFLGNLSSHSFVYSYDQTNWNYFDNNGPCKNGPSTIYYIREFSNDTPFTQPDVYVAYCLPYPTSRIESYVDEISLSEYVSPLPSGGDFVLGYGAGGVDDSGRTIEGQPIYGFTITDSNSSFSEKSKVVLSGGNHSGEPLGNLVLEGAIDFLLSDSPAATRLREQVEFYVYPMISPDGREAGYYRGGPEDALIDPNRVWDDPTGVTNVSIVREAMLSDTGGEVDYLLDFHQFFDTTGPEDYYHIDSHDYSGTFQAALALLEPELEAEFLTNIPGVLQKWAFSSAGLDAYCSITAEFAAVPGVTEQDMADYGASYMLALHECLVSVPEPISICGLISLGLVFALYRRRRR
jgi:Zinc carboxypeptidase